MDQEVIALCRALNSIKGINTTGSCCGHGTEPLTVWMNADSVKYLSIFLWAGCHRHWDWKGWHLSLDVADPNRKEKARIHFVLTTEDKGEPAYARARELADKIDAAVDSLQQWWED